MTKLVAILFVIVLAAGCSKNPNDELTALSGEFVNTTLSFSPSAATGAGLHKFKSQNLDDLLDDMSLESLDKQRQFYEDFRNRLAALNRDQLTAEGRADLSLMDDQITANLLDLTEIRSARHNPALYVEILGNALFNCYVLEYAPKPDRIRNIISRLQKTPLFLDQASTNLSNSTPLWI